MGTEVTLGGQEAEVAVLALLLTCQEILGRCLSLPDASSASLMVPVSSWTKAEVACGHSRDQKGTQAVHFPRCWGPHPLRLRLLFGQMALNTHPVVCED